MPESEKAHNDTGSSGWIDASPAACGDSAVSLWWANRSDSIQFLIPGRLCCFFQKPSEILPNI